MTDSTRDMLYQHVNNVAEMIAEYGRQIESGQYGNQWTVTSDDNCVHVVATDADDALYHGQLAMQVGDDADLVAEHDQLDEPTVEETPISDYPLEIVDQRGREFAVVIGTGGPHIEVVANGGYDARLEGYWGGEHVTLSGDYLNTFLDYFIDRDNGEY